MSSRDSGRIQVAYDRETGNLELELSQLYELAPDWLVDELSKKQIYDERLIQGAIEVLVEGRGYMWEGERPYSRGWRFPSDTIRELRRHVIELAPDIIRTAFDAAYSHARHYWSSYWQEREHRRRTERTVYGLRRYAEWLEKIVETHVDDAVRESYALEADERFGSRKPLALPAYHPPDEPDWGEGYRVEPEDRELRDRVERLLECLAQDPRVDLCLDPPELPDEEEVETADA